MRIVLVDNRGDEHYIGLDRMEIYDEKGRRIAKEKVSCIESTPFRGVDHLPEMQKDDRLIDNILDSELSTKSTPFLT